MTIQVILAGKAWVSENDGWTLLKGSCDVMIFNFLYIYTHKNYKRFKVTSKSHDFDDSIIYIIIDDTQLLWS